MTSETLHEDPSTLKPETVDRHRAIASLMEELEAIDWYDQRVNATTDEKLRAILAHNRDEEKEHAAMVLEWLRRNDPKFHDHLRTYLFTEADVTTIEDEVEHGGASGGEGGGNRPANGSLGIGSLKGER
jgi:uncharacterized protein